MELVLLFWAVCGVIGAALAQSKDRSPLHGGLIGLLAGPIGVLIVAFQSKLKPGETERTGIGKPVRYLAISTGVLVALIVVLAIVTG